VIFEELGLTEDDIVVESYENMTREELIACLNAADAHHQEHHQWQDDLRRENEELKAKLDKAKNSQNFMRSSKLLLMKEDKMKRKNYGYFVSRIGRLPIIGKILKLCIQKICGIKGHQFDGDWGYSSGDYADVWCRHCDKFSQVPKTSIWFRDKESKDTMSQVGGVLNDKRNT